MMLGTADTEATDLVQLLFLDVGLEDFVRPGAPP